ncbi:unnamed protein product [Lepidochelys kempii]
MSVSLCITSLLVLVYMLQGQGYPDEEEKYNKKAKDKSGNKIFIACLSPDLISYNKSGRSQRLGVMDGGSREWRRRRRLTLSSCTDPMLKADAPAVTFATCIHRKDPERERQRQRRNRMDTETCPG